MDIGNFRLESTRPRVVLVVYPAAPTVAEIRLVFAAFAQLAERGQARAYVIDFRNFDPIRSPASTRKAAADSYHLHADIFRKHTVCEARVVTSAISRGTLTAFDWLTGTKWPCANFATAAEADAWVDRRLQRSDDAKLGGSPHITRA